MTDETQVWEFVGRVLDLEDDAERFAQPGAAPEPIRTAALQLKGTITSLAGGVRTLSNLERPAPRTDGGRTGDGSARGGRTPN
jgi:hypothetical protein